VTGGLPERTIIPAFRHQRIGAWPLLTTCAK
jgi:hypothetical protein